MASTRVPAARRLEAMAGGLGRGTYGDHLTAEVARVFPELFEQTVAPPDP